MANKLEDFDYNRLYTFLGIAGHETTYDGEALNALRQAQKMLNASGLSLANLRISSLIYSPPVDTTTPLSRNDLKTQFDLTTRNLAEAKKEIEVLQKQLENQTNVSSDVAVLQKENKALVARIAGLEAENVKLTARIKEAVNPDAEPVAKVRGKGEWKKICGNRIVQEKDNGMSHEELAALATTLSGFPVVKNMIDGFVFNTPPPTGSVIVQPPGSNKPIKFSELWMIGWWLRKDKEERWATAIGRNLNILVPGKKFLIDKCLKTITEHDIRKLRRLYHQTAKPAVPMSEKGPKIVKTITERMLEYMQANGPTTYAEIMRKYFKQKNNQEFFQAWKELTSSPHTAIVKSNDDPYRSIYRYVEEND